MMRCIFCQNLSGQLKVVEHIIPESLGNKEHFLPPGVVCDKCNQYFGSKIEKPLLESDYFRHARFRTETPSKKGRIPSISAFLFPTGLGLEYFIDKEGNRGVAARSEKDVAAWIKYLETHQHGNLIILKPKRSDEKLFSRFLGKVAIEVLAHRYIKRDGWLEHVATDPQLDPLRRYARFGKGSSFWPFRCRRIYPEDHAFVDDTGQFYEVLHEFTILYTRQKELYLVLAIYGIEYAINYAGPELEGYEMWLRENNNRSYLQMVEAS
ncbi:HNH endonuclease [candidate division WOR-3 bacterium]|nr:HNH endonuclease [candidate division WOR-3 bacterium]